MRWLIPAILLLFFKANAQPDFGFQSLARETSASLDDFGYLDPDFKWDMEGRVQAALNEGINYLKEGTPNLSLPQLDKALALDPRLWVAYYYKAVCLKMQRRYGEAMYNLNLADRHNQNNFFVYLELGKTYDLLKRYDEGEKYFEMAGKVNPQSGIPMYCLGNHYLNANKNVAAAKKYFENSLQIDSMMLDAEVRLGLLAALQKKDATTEVTKYMENVLRKDSLHKQALLFHGMIMMDSNPKTSLRDWNRLVRVSPGNYFFRLMRGVMLTSEERYEEAFSDLRKIVEQGQVNENTFTGEQTEHDKAINLTYAGYYVMANVYGFPDEDAALIRKAYCLLFVGKNAESQSAISAVNTAYESPLCLFLKAIASEHGGDHQKAFHFYNTALQYDNDILDAHKKRGIYYTELQRWVEAEKDFTEMLRINGEAFYAYRLRGISQYHRSNYDGAIADFTKYIERDSSNMVVYGFRGMAYRRNKQVLPSTYDFLKSKNYQAVENFNVVTVEIEKVLADKDTTKAVWWLQRFISADPNYGDAQLLHLHLLVVMKRWTDVESYANRALYRNAKDEAARRLNTAVYTTVAISTILTAKATALVNQGNTKKAIEELEVAINLDKKNPDAYLFRGKAHLALNNKPAAIKDLKKADQLVMRRQRRY